MKLLFRLLPEDVVAAYIISVNNVNQVAARSLRLLPKPS